ncbi:MAG: chitobiase/beta-hexosaminidase C-terminal domain-containing protein, partial [Planctomycetales bacterium]|nr:chitobiase/beta-hexosaminidase C-terminal domain-containing protein [Planctomycetales bacterium]
DQFFAEPTPGADNGVSQPAFLNPVSISPAHGFFEQAFTATITSPDSDTVIRYTLDGSTPSDTNGTIYTGPISINGTSNLRAASFKAGVVPSLAETASYLFLDDVIRQSPNGETPEGWPAAPVKGQRFDYGMDPDIVDNPEWSSQIKDALTQIPTISLVTDMENLVDPGVGIYVNPAQDGREWERPASVELINPDGSTGFQINAGLRIRGGFSRGSANPKHSFRLFFRSAYGEPTLNFPLFEDEGVDSFKAIDLRTAQNYAWSNSSFNDETRNTFLRDIYSRDLQGALGQEYTRGRYYHLYLNGQYWGMFQTEERPEANFAADYFGGDPEDYDAIKASGGTLEATDGTLDVWNEFWTIANAGFNSLEDYYFVQGKNPDGTDNPDYTVYVQPDAVIDFMINVFFTGNQDMPVSLGGDVANNFWAVFDRTGRDGWQFIAHDNEHNMLSETFDGTRDSTAGRVRTSFNPKYIHQQLDALEEYRLAFADRVQKHFFNDGPLTTENATALMQRRAAQIDQAIIAESARWGDQHNTVPLNKNTWLAEVDWLYNTFLARRREIVLGQFRNRDLFPELAAASLNQYGGQVDVGFPLTVNSPVGDIYYTLNGTDPRLAGGSLHPDAIRWNGQPIRLQQDANVSVRVLDGQEWSPIVESEFVVGQAALPTSLRITEIHYNPGELTLAEMAAGYSDKDEFEFIELMNVSTSTIDLSSAKLVRTVTADGEQGVEFDFANSAIQRLVPGQRVVVVENIDAFELRYGSGISVAGEWSGGLSNNSETLQLNVGDQVLQRFAYDDAWYPATDGQGASLELINPNQLDLTAWGSANSWRASSQIGGSPGSASLVPGDANGDGLFNSTDLVLVFQAGEYEDNIDGNSAYSEGDWNGDGDFNTSDLVFAFQAGTYSSLALPTAPLAASRSQLESLRTGKERSFAATDLTMFEWDERFDDDLEDTLQQMVR